MTQFALVTGASRGLGRAIATHLSRKDYSVILASRDEAALRTVKKELQGKNHLALPADLGSPNGIAALASGVHKHVGKNGLAAFVHCAAQTPDPAAEAMLADTTDDTIDGHLRTTASAAVRLLKALKPVLSAPGRSHGILIASDWVIDGITGPPVFSAAKAFAAAVWRHSRVEYLRDGIVLSTIVPGNIATYDESWQVAKWSLDNSIADVQAELGKSRIALQDMLGVIDLIMSTPLAAITEVRLVPLDPDYKP